MKELASAYYRANDFTRATETFQKAAAAAHKAGDKEAKDQLLVRLAHSRRRCDVVLRLSRRADSGQ